MGLCGSILPRTPFGQDLGPRLVLRLGVGLAQDAVGLQVDPTSGRWLVTRPAYGGNAMATVALLFTPQIVTVRRKVFEPAAKQENSRGKGDPGPG